MGRYIAIRLLGLIGVLIAVSFITFILMHAVPAGPFDMIGMGEKQLPKELKDQLNRLYGLDKPVLEQYVLYVRNAVRLDFGNSFSQPGKPVSKIIFGLWPVSIQLGLLTMIFSFIVGGGLGVAAAMRQGSWVDSLGTGVSIFCFIMPSFVLAYLLIIVFAIQLKWLPTGGWGTPKQAIMPVIANSLGPILVLQRYTRSSMLDVMRSNYVRTARAKGLSERRVTWIHILKNALIPVITVAGPMVASLVVGSFFIESIFRIPGVGSLFVAALSSRDYTMIMGGTLLFAVLIGVSYLVSDMLYAAVDPRVTFVKEK
jgi:ABC-type dipeptide/oligopeptide/nickel transport system permease component